MTSGAATAAFRPTADAPDDRIDAAASWAYRRQARRLRDRFRHDAAGLHASLRTLAVQADAAAPPRPPVRPSGRTRLVASRVVPIGEPTADRPPMADPFVRPTVAVAMASSVLPATPAAAVPPPAPSPRVWAHDSTVEPHPPAEPAPACTVGPTVRGVLNAAPEAVDEFATLARAALADGPIGYGRRQALVRRADALRIGRFEAALILAAVEHRHRTYAPTASVTVPPVRRRTVVLAVAAALLLETAILVALLTR